MPKYTIGVDFGSLSGRAVLVNIEDGEIVKTVTHEYKNGVINKAMPNGKILGKGWSIQNPNDYLQVLIHCIKKIISNISVNDVVGVGIDFPLSTYIPVKSDGTPLCFIEKYKNNPHAYAKTCKHFSCIDKEKKICRTAYELNEQWAENLNNNITDCGLFAKLWEIAENDIELYNDIDYFIEASEWIVWQLTGKLSACSASSGFKSLYNKKTGYPSKSFLLKLYPVLDAALNKLNTNIQTLGTKSGEITKNSSDFTGLKIGTAVASPNTDVTSCFPALNITESNKLLLIIGSISYCITMNKSNQKKVIPFDIIEDGIYEGYHVYKSTRLGIAEHFEWFLNNCVPPEYFEEAKKECRNLHSLLAQKMMKINPKDNKLITIDNWSETDDSYKGTFIGMDFNTKTENLYMSLIESTAFSTRQIVENLINNGIKINEIYGAGTIAEKNPFIMQLYSDILNIPIKISGTSKAPALGSAITAAVAAGSEKGGYNSIKDACNKMSKLKDKIYYPIKENVQTYNILYNEYCKIKKTFIENNIMKNIY